MAAANSNQLSTLVANMFTAGLLDDQFRQLEMLQDEGNPDFVAKVVMLFCEEGEHIIGELAKQLDQPCVDYGKVDTFVDQLRGNSAW
ncbi:hypothetical protein ACQJBY_061722 [Aegilops geniculata]